MIDWRSSEFVTLNTEHGNINSALDAGFVMPRLPTEGSFKQRTGQQTINLLALTGVFDETGGQFGVEFFKPLGKSLPGTTLIHTKGAQLDELTKTAFQEHLYAVMLSGIGQSDGCADNQSQVVGLQMSFKNTKPVPDIVTNALRPVHYMKLLM